MSQQQSFFRRRSRRFDNDKHVAGKGALQVLDLIPGAREPQVDFFRRRQDRRHRLEMNRSDDLIRRCRQETEQLIFPFAITYVPNALPWRPEAGTSKVGPRYRQTRRSGSCRLRLCWQDPAPRRR